ncbi:MAG: ABC-ATPase domain-containing protein [Blautia sp.]|nr:ABC-ATPase domain-containing protein [Blautia sp.]MCM1199854.1 ABC-ATPase domain-containing protein [Bacteroides fragilis]
MKSSEELRNNLRSINHKSYPAYKSLAGNYSFGKYILNIEHVQGDPFAAPSRLSVEVNHKIAGFPASCYGTKWNKTALEDYLIRRFQKQADRFCFQAKGSGKSGIITVSRCGQEIMERTACEITASAVMIRFEAGFPANGRSINAPELEKILFDFIPVCVEQSLYYEKTPKQELERVIFLAEDQHFIREEMKKQNIVAFVADGSILPRESGVSDRPLKDGIPFCAPETMKVVFSLPHKGNLQGMGIRKGITLIVGGGYHGKSTLLKALERGVYNHIAGDGREYVITDETALKLRAEDGRKITNTDISLFINHLPNGKNTENFCTLDASGSTSQAANIVEGIEAGSKLLLIDEDTSATNFMVRDELMQKIVAREKEPITPFLERAKDLYEKAGVSTILVIGSCGSYFHIADKVIQMDSYRAVDITDETKEIMKDYPAPAVSAPGFHLPSEKREIDLSGSSQKRKTYRGNGYVEERLKIKRMGKTAFSIGKESLDLRYVEQLVDEEQTQTLAYLLRYAKEHYGDKKTDIVSVVRALENILKTKGLAGICDKGNVPSGLAMPRVQEIFACFSRY